jgi:HD-GYP domain-containing protein (c-di-GMP phosphodiesterase class II)
VNAAVATAEPTIATADLQVGMFVHLDLGWMSHPFALSSFRIADASQIETIRALGLTRVRWSPQQSELPDAAPPPAATNLQAVQRARRASASRDTVAQALAAQRAATERVERQYGEAARGWRQAMERIDADPVAAGHLMAALAQAMVEKMLGARELSIRALAETPGDRASHAMNVGVLAMVMGRQCGLAEADLADLGVGALAHDVGKAHMPVRLHKPDPEFSPAEMAAYREHVAQGVLLGQRMGLAPGALLVIGQHHEHCDGSGFPLGLDVNRMSIGARLVALVNRYDNLCHPAPGVSALTPHEAMSLLFSQGQSRYDAAILSTFVRMMGVYPPGSVVQLTDDRWAVVESVNAARPLKPRVTIHEPRRARDELPLTDLATLADLGIRRAAALSQVPRAVAEQLMPRTRHNWYFDIGPEADEPETPAH